MCGFGEKRDNVHGKIAVVLFTWDFSMVYERHKHNSCHLHCIGVAETLHYLRKI